MLTDYNEIKHLQDILTKASTIKYGYPSKDKNIYVKSGNELKSLATFLYDRGINARNIEVKAALQAFIKVPGGIINEEDYPLELYDLIPQPEKPNSPYRLYFAKLSCTKCRGTGVLNFLPKIPE